MTDKSKGKEKEETEKIKLFYRDENFDFYRTETNEYKIKYTFLIKNLREPDIDFLNQFHQCWESMYSEPSRITVELWASSIQTASMFIIKEQVKFMNKCKNLTECKIEKVSIYCSRLVGHILKFLFFLHRPACPIDTFYE